MRLTPVVVFLTVDGRLEGVQRLGCLGLIRAHLLCRPARGLDLWRQGLQRRGVAAAAAFQVGAACVEGALALLQLLYVGAQLDFPQQVHVAGGSGLHFPGRHFHVLKGVLHFARDGAGAKLVDHLELGFLNLPHAHIQGVLRHVAQDFDLEVGNRLGAVCQPVALPDDAALALLNVGRLPRHVKVVQRHQSLLHVGAGAHLLR